KPVIKDDLPKPVENSDKGSFFFRLPRYLFSFFQGEQVVSKTDAVNSKEEPTSSTSKSQNPVETKENASTNPSEKIVDQSNPISKDLENKSDNKTQVNHPSAEL
ncbi:hypothetical protein TUBRATIS_009060, partial [Tubulinosema ratisbonensis]